MADKPERHRMPDPDDPLWGSPVVRSPENTPGWFKPLLVFLKKYSSLSTRYWWKWPATALRFLTGKTEENHDLRIIWVSADLQEPDLPGDSEAITRKPWVIELHKRVRWHLFREFHYRPPPEILLKWREEGALILFRQIAYAEFWQADIFGWPARYLADRERWDREAMTRARLLLWIWGVQNPVPIVPPGKPPLEAAE